MKEMETELITLVLEVGPESLKTTKWIQVAFSNLV